MQNNTGIDLKPVIDEAKSVPVDEPVLSNELGWFHSAAQTMQSGARAGRPTASLPKTHLGDFLQRATKISSGTLVTTDSFGTIKFTLDPWKEFLESTFIAPKVSNYRYIRGSLEVQISVNAPAGAYGLYYLVAVPFGVGPSNFQGSNGVLAFSPNISKTLPHIEIDLAKCTDGKLLLPWCHWNDYATLGDNSSPEGYVGMWALTLRCMQPIATATGTDTPEGTYRIWARCVEDHDMVIPYTQMMPNSFDDVRAAANSEFESARDSINKTTIDAVGMKPSGIAGAIATGATAVAAAVPFLAPLAGPAAAIASGVSAVLSWFGFTREMAQQTPTTIVRRNYSNVANMDCDDTSEVAALLRENAISVDPRLAGNCPEDEAAFNYIMSKWVLVGACDWTQSDTFQQELCSFPVTPFLARRGMDVATYFTTAGYLGFPFEYWRGDMEYLLVIPFSKFHRGVLQVSWSPGAAVTIDDITNTRYNHILDCSTCTNWKFTVGYVNPTPMLETIPHKFDAPIISSAGANGIVTISVANPLTSPVEVASTRIWIFARGCANMDFAVPRDTFIPLNDDGSLGAARDFATGFRLQMSGAIGNDALVEQQFNLVPGTMAPVKEISSGERFDSVRGLCQKFSQYSVIQRSLSSSQGSEYINHFPSYPQPNQYFDCSNLPRDITDTQCFTWCGYYGAMFTGIAASTRYKFVNNSNTPLAIGVSKSTTAFATNTSISKSINTVNPVWTVNTGEAVEITVPYYYNRRFFPTHFWTKVQEVVNGTAQGRADLIRVHVPTNSTASNFQGVTGYVAYGPDIRFGMFRLCPAISLATADEFSWTSNNAPPG